MEPIARRDQLDGRMHAVVYVVAGPALVEVGHGRCQAEMVKESGDAGIGHASPVVVSALEQTRNHSELRGTCASDRGAWRAPLAGEKRA